MVQEIRTQPSIFGRIGQGFGQGLAESIPKEIEHQRLRSGLQNLANQSDQGNLSPAQFLAQAAGTYGATPQIVQSFGELARQQARGQALKNQNTQQASAFPQRNSQSTGQPESKIPSLTKEDVFAKAQEGYIPSTIEERDEIASKAYNSNPAFFGNDPQKALDWADQKIFQEEKIAEAYQKKHKNLSEIQDKVIERLKGQSEKLNTKVPADLYTQIEDQAIQDTKPRKDGGRGLTEQQTIKEYGEKLDDASRVFSKIKEVGAWGTSLRPAGESLRSLKNLQKDMKKLGQTDNFAKRLQSEIKLSPKMSYAIAEPVSDIPGLNLELQRLPEGNVNETPFETIYDVPGTLEIASRLAKYVKENELASPLAIAHELEKKGYDAAKWLQYLTDHSDELNLRKRQSEQASTPLNIVTPWNDWWLSSFTGIK